MTTMTNNYAKRANEFERIYDRPERQSDLRSLAAHLRGEVTGRRVLEVACGTGYWTAIAASAAEHIFATDINEEVLALARAKELPPSVVTFENLDAFRPKVEGQFDVGLACFWWSHIPVDQLSTFLSHFHASLTPSAKVVFIDNRFVPGSSTAISETDADGNTYQLRQLADGSTHRVLKNFPSPAFLRSTLSAHSDSIHIVEFDYFWCASYILR